MKEFPTAYRDQYQLIHSQWLKTSGLNFLFFLSIHSGVLGQHAVLGKHHTTPAAATVAGLARKERREGKRLLQAREV